MKTSTSFATALKILVGSAIKNSGLEKAELLLREYLLKFAVVCQLHCSQDWLLTYQQLYGRDAMRPNHHWSVHIPEQVRDFGTLYSFWAFLTERLNKILKNVNSNNWGGGSVEVSMMREFQRAAKLDGLVREFPILLNIPQRLPSSFII
jgi:hypothetical protein